MAEPGVIELTAAFRKQTRQLKRGVEDRYTIEFHADNVVLDLSDSAIKAHMHLVSEAIAESISTEIGQIAQEAAPSTIARRERAMNDRKTKWYRQHYAGGRIGEMPPSPGETRLFNDSGRLKRIAVNFRRTSRNTHVATLNFPANRFNPQMLGGRIHQMIDQIRQLVPSMRGEFRGESATRVGTALDVAAGLMIMAGDSTTELLRLQAQMLANAAAMGGMRGTLTRILRGKK